jgi:hypothetical protein
VLVLFCWQIPSENFVSFYSYKANCGEGEVWGDAVTDLNSAKLEVRTLFAMPPCATHHQHRHQAITVSLKKKKEFVFSR